MSLDWSRYPNFTEEEFRCSHTGKCNMRPEFMDALQQIRATFGKPMVVTSGFRHHTHPAEDSKPEPGEHSYGLAADISLAGIAVADLISIARGYGIARFGIHQKGPFASRYIHIGMGDKLLNFPQGLWTY